MQFNAHLRELIESVEIFSESYPQGRETNTEAKPACPAKPNGRLNHVPRPAPEHDTFAA